jgi:hypothetical protein
MYELHRLGIITLGELLLLPRESVREAPGDSSTYIEQIQELLDQFGMQWDA